jgi:hypothetical protein
VIAAVRVRLDLGALREAMRRRVAIVLAERIEREEPRAHLRESEGEGADPHANLTIREWRE